MKLKFLGAAGTVTGSSYILTANDGQSILIDLGMFQGTPDIEELNYLPYDYDLSQVSHALVTHAHLDHVGRLPILISHGFTGQIYMTPATSELAYLTLSDSAKIAAYDDKQALYDQALVDSTFERIVTKDYHQSFACGNFDITFYNAGHLLGAASIHIRDRSSGSPGSSIIFSGDLGQPPEELLLDSQVPPSAGAVVIESTYGDRLHPALDPLDELQAQINAVEDGQSTLLIPAFSLEKTQELLHLIKHLKKSDRINHDTTVFMDGPMAIKTTQIYRQYPQLLNRQVQSELVKGDPFDFPGLVVTKSFRHSKKIRRHSGAKVIIAGAGMMTGGRIVSHAAAYLSNPLNRIYFVGYQAEETPGRAILEGSSLVALGDNEVEIAATVASTGAMSAHADQKQLLNWLGGISGVSKVFITHGEDHSRAALAEKIHQQLHISDISLPGMNQEVGF